jgi:hypothetical protein
MFPIAPFDKLPDVKFQLTTNREYPIIVFERDIRMEDAMNPDSIFQIYKDFLLTDEKGQEFAKKIHN